MKITKYFLCLFALTMTLGMGVAKADLYTFVQTGFDDGGTISGTFTGSDLDNDGQIVSIQGSLNELTGLNATYTGGTNIPNLTFDLSSLFGFVYNVGTQYLGDDLNGFVEGIGFLDLAGNQYLSGMGLLSMFGGLLIDQGNGGFSTTSANLIEITSVSSENQNNVPLPTSLMLLVFAALLMKRNRD